MTTSRTKPKQKHSDPLDEIFAEASQKRQSAKARTWVDYLSESDRELVEAARKRYQQNRTDYPAGHLATSLLQRIKTKAAHKTITLYLGKRDDG